MTFARQVWHLSVKEFKLEWRNRYAINGILLYLLSIVFLIYLSFEKLEGILWILLFWITLLFSAANAIARSFLQEGEGRRLYYYTIANPQAVILSKMIYNWALMILLSLIAVLFFAAVAGFPVVQLPMFLMAIFFGGAGFSFLFSMVSAIASKAANTGTLMTILSFPVLIPILRLLIAISAGSLITTDALTGMSGIVLIGAIDILIVALALVLFPYLWRD